MIVQSPTGRVRGWCTLGLATALVVCLVLAGFVIAAPSAIGVPHGAGGPVPGLPAGASAADPIVTTDADGGPLNPARPIELTAHDGTLAAVAVTDRAGRTVPGALAADGASWASTGPLG